MADSTTLVSGVYPQRTQPDAGLTVDAGAAADDVPDDVLGRLSHDRQAREDVAVRPEPVDQHGFYRDGHTGAGERGVVDGEDGGSVT
jgi:hypothetical protein